MNFNLYVNQISYKRRPLLARQGNPIYMAFPWRDCSHSYLKMYAGLDVAWMETGTLDHQFSSLKLKQLI